MKKIGINNFNEIGEKSIFSTLLANTLHLTTDWNVLLMDMDYPDYPTGVLREKETQIIKEDDFYKKLFIRQFKEISKKSYPIITCRIEETYEKLDEFLENEKTNFDIIIYEMGGNVGKPEELSIYLSMDYIFCPLFNDRNGMELTLSFVETLNKYNTNAQLSKIKDIFLFWNENPDHEDKMMLNVYSEIIKKLNLKVLNTEINLNSYFEKEDSKDDMNLRSTIFLPTLFTTNQINLLAWTKEIINLIMI